MCTLRSLQCLRHLSMQCACSTCPQRPVLAPHMLDCRPAVRQATQRSPHAHKHMAQLAVASFSSACSAVAAVSARMRRCTGSSRSAVLCCTVCSAMSASYNEKAPWEERPLLLLSDAHPMPALLPLGGLPWLRRVLPRDPWLPRRLRRC